jgi:hypothetical protein
MNPDFVNQRIYNLKDTKETELLFQLYDLVDQVVNNKIDLELSLMTS